jgi:uncharacterized membrane protein YqjE
MSTRQEHTHENDERHRLVPLVKETADNFSRLMADHLKLARVELAADIKENARRMAFLVAAASVLALGYSLGCVALALGLAPWLGTVWAFSSVAGVHVLGGGIALAVVRHSAATARPMRETLREIDRSVAALSAGRRG